MLTRLSGPGELKMDISGAYTSKHIDRCFFSINHGIIYNLLSIIFTETVNNCKKWRKKYFNGNKSKTISYIFCNFQVGYIFSCWSIYTSIVIKDDKNLHFSGNNSKIYRKEKFSHVFMVNRFVKLTIFTIFTYC